MHGVWLMLFIPLSSTATWLVGVVGGMTFIHCNRRRCPISSSNNPPSIILPRPTFSRILIPLPRASLSSSTPHTFPLESIFLKDSLKVNCSPPDEFLMTVLLRGTRIRWWEDEAVSTSTIVAFFIVQLSNGKRGQHLHQSGT